MIICCFDFEIDIELFFNKFNGFVVIKAPSSKMNDFTKTPQTPSMWTIYTSFTSPIAML